MEEPHAVVPFSEAFRVHAAIQEIVSAAFRDGAPIILRAAILTLRSVDADATLPGADLEDALATAATEAGVTIIDWPAAA